MLPPPKKPITILNSTHTDACSRWDAHMEFIERERHE